MHARGQCQFVCHLGRLQGNALGQLRAPNPLLDKQLLVPANVSTASTVWTVFSRIGDASSTPSSLVQSATFTGSRVGETEGIIAQQAATFETRGNLSGTSETEGCIPASARHPFVSASETTDSGCPFRICGALCLGRFAPFDLLRGWVRGSDGTWQRDDVPDVPYGTVPDALRNDSGCSQMSRDAIITPSEKPNQCRIITSDLLT
ncbi:phosphopantothenoylcysteine decarboxylase/phosphopantothenate/cysteine ligase [Anopheles sinensis]|uniref:Phosphopantothenoylcysteine decarboxylase/phosphopantothenate/cysteine ligase n=1 Tax=Anopheles sinensis TaxID=74873 RepID=A0A084VAW9_ANOSI|nr:phosphopantothenoylcysteine decarboxylase/phosphopantothenate/cysteine ligase [Anopheles sinensis]